MAGVVLFALGIDLRRDELISGGLFPSFFSARVNPLIFMFLDVFAADFGILNGLGDASLHPVYWLFANPLYELVRLDCGLGARK